MPENLTSIPDLRQSAVSRRTLAKTAAWAAPAIVLSTATPAFAASPTIAGRIALTGAPYSLTSTERRTITGNLTPTAGTVPADIVLSASVSAPFTIVSQPVVSGTTFSFDVVAPSPATTAKSITVTSVNYPGYTQATGQISSLAPGMATANMCLVPYANNWIFEEDDEGVRWYGLNRAAFLNPLTTTNLVDLRTSFSGDPNNIGNAPFDTTYTLSGGYPAGWTLGTFACVTQVEVWSGGTVMANSAALASGVKTKIGSWSGTGSCMALPVASTLGPWLPYQDPSLKTLSLYTINVATKMPAGTQTNVRVLQVLNGPGNASVQMGFRFSTTQS